MYQHFFNHVLIQAPTQSTEPKLSPSGCRRVRMAWVLGILLLTAAVLQAGQDNPPAASFTLQEYFGVSHPDQIITFDLVGSVDPQRMVLIDESGKEVVYQQIGRAHV